MTALNVDAERKCTADRVDISNKASIVCTADRHTKDIVRLRSYSLPHEPNIRATICQAALATSAATTFFEPVSIGDRSFADGGLGANNPVDEVEGESSNIWCSETGDLKPLVKCFISIGRGNPGKKPFEDSIIFLAAPT
jgi:predicted acylesterase/phospholipase RssA